MKSIETEVLVVGGGATGVGVARDAALRGFDTVLVERKDLAEGTTGRYHGLLHSGGRYAVKDPQAARECAAENVVLRRIAADTIEDTGGLFVTTPWDDPEFGDRFVRGCAENGVPVEEIEVADALRREPALHPKLRRAFLVADASMDSWKLVWACARSAHRHGARILTYRAVTEVLRDGDAVAGVVVVDPRTGDELAVHARLTVNATGAWAGRLTVMAGCREVEVVPGKGIMIAMNHRIVNTVVNRCTMPSDGDILVPIRTVSVMGTTDSPVRDPDELEITQAEVDHMLEEGEKLVPGFRSYRALRVWAGARPLFGARPPGDGVTGPRAPGGDTRDITRAHALIDHAERDGVGGFVTITGGKATTFRLMAEETVDLACRKLDGAEAALRPCRTATELLPDAENGYYSVRSRLAAREENLLDDQLVCECELVTRGTLEAALERRPTANIDDVRRALRLGMGPCQGGFCTYRAAGILHCRQQLDQAAANAALLGFLQERWKGVAPILYGDQLRQARLDDWLYQGLLDVEHLPA
jgi:glycerol-3-phosphate dehydrogenase